MSAHEVAATREREQRAAFVAMVTESGMSLAEFAGRLPESVWPTIAEVVASWHQHQAHNHTVKAWRAGAVKQP